MTRFLFYLSFFVTPASGQALLHSSINENCPAYLNCAGVGLAMNTTSSDKARTNLLHVWLTTPEKSDDFAHFFVSTVNYSPTFVAVVSHAENDVTLQWSATDVKLIGAVNRSIAVTLKGIYQYLDVNDVADVDNVSPKDVYYYSLNDIHWQQAKVDDQSRQIVAKYCHEPDKNAVAAFGENATICFSVRAYNESGREETPPTQEYSGPSDFIVEVELSNMMSIGKQTRYALDMQIVSNNQKKSAFEITELTNINDEYTPSVFRTVYIQLNSSEHGFATWKPVAYKSSAKDRSSQTQTITNGIRPVHSFMMLGGILNSECFQGASIAAYNVTLGYPKDKFYGNYSSWLFEQGTDRPPVTNISTLLNMLIILTILVPLLGVLIVVYYLVKRKLQPTEPPFQPLVQDS